MHTAPARRFEKTLISAFPNRLASGFANAAATNPFGCLLNISVKDLKG
jgi:hypothetical protein